MVHVALSAFQFCDKSLLHTEWTWNVPARNGHHIVTRKVPTRSVYKDGILMFELTQNNQLHMSEV